MIDSDEFDTLGEALRGALAMIEDENVSEVSIVSCRYSPRHEAWVEIVGGPMLTIQTHNWPCSG